MTGWRSAMRQARSATRRLKGRQGSWHESPEKNESIHANNGYGENVVDNKSLLLSALGLDIEVETEEKD